MKALVYNGPGQKSWVEKEKPEIEKPTDVIVRITKTTICGTDLHILKGDVPAVTPGRTLGHEGVGIVEAVGDAVANFKPGDPVLIGSGQNMGVIFVVAARAKVSSLRVGLPWTYGLQSKLPSTTGRSALISLTAFHDPTG